MGDIRINPDQVENTGNQFNAKRGELDGLISQANSYMKSLQGSWTGQRATKTFSQWEEMQPSLKAASETLSAAGGLLKSAATEFRSVDSA